MRYAVLHAVPGSASQPTIVESSLPPEVTSNGALLFFKVDPVTTLDAVYVGFSHGQWHSFGLLEEEGAWRNSVD